MKLLVRAGTGTPGSLVNALQDRIDMLEDGIVTSTKVTCENDLDYKYEIQDTQGLPQTGMYDSYKFEEWWELEDFLDNNPDVMENIQDGYATIVELD